MNSSRPGNGSGDQSSVVCLEKYTGIHCQQPLRTCSPGNPEIFISNLVDNQPALGEDIDVFLDFLDLLIQPSDECRRRIVPFLCLYTFGLCDENDADYRPKAAECLDIRDNVCESEWQEANSLLESFGVPPLPDCSTFSDDGLVCSSDNCERSPTISLDQPLENNHRFYIF